LQYAAAMAECEMTGV